MTEIVERVARALRRKCAEIDARPDVRDADAMWFADEYARAAIKAMREPSEGMLIAGVKAMCAEMPDGKPAASAVIYGQPKLVFQAMVDRALEESDGR